MSPAWVTRRLHSFSLQPMRGIWPGMLLCIVIATAAAFIADTRGGPTLLYALLLGIALHSVTVDSNAQAGIDFAARCVLRLGVALLGARITLEQIGELGWFNATVVVTGVLATILFGIWLSRLLGVEQRLGVLTGGATAICGASAAIAIATVLPRDEHSERELIFTIAGVTVLSTLAMVLYPTFVQVFDPTPSEAGIFLGGTIHDVAQVVGAGYSVSQEVGDYSVLTKMLRVAMLLPVVLTLSLMARQRGLGAPHEARDPLLPPFLLGFVALVAAGSLGWIPVTAAGAMSEVSRACLVVAIAAVGLKTSLLDIRKVGRRAAALLGLEALFLVVFVLLAQQLH